MRPLTEATIRACFVNASGHDLERMALPELDSQPWEQLDFLGWVDQGMPHVGYIVLAYADAVLGLRLLIPAGGPGHPRRSMCNICHCVQPGGGVRLMSIPRAGELGARYNVIGSYLCADLACSLYLRGLRQVPAMHQLHETMNLDARVAGLRSRINDLVSRVFTDGPGLDTAVRSG